MESLSSSSFNCVKPSGNIVLFNTKSLLSASSCPVVDDRPRRSTSFTTITSAAATIIRQRPYPNKNLPLQPTESIIVGSSSPPTQKSHLVIRILDWFDTIINTFIDPPIQPWVNPRFVLSDNFAPVDELPPTECHVTFGSLPTCLDGAYMRVGPNPQFEPRGPYHLFDGDGMVHCLHITGNGTRATLSSRYIQTYRFKVERQAGASLFPNLLSGFNGLAALLARGALTAARVAFGQFNPKNGMGLANTSLALVGGKLYALYESDLPYEIQVTSNGDVLTIGRQDFNGQLSSNMTAHPKLDPQTGEVFAFQYGPFRPFLNFFRIDKFGKKSADVPIFSMKTPTVVHDFAITEKYAIFPDTQLGVDPVKMIFQGGSPIELDQAKVPRLGVIPRDADDESEMRWFDVPGFNILHSINAWDEVDELGNEFITLVAPNVLSAEHFMKRMELIQPWIERVRIDLCNGIVSRITLPVTTNLEFGVINPSYVGRKNRFVYASFGGPNPINIAGVVKLDLEATKDHNVVVAKRTYGKDCYAGEAFFVAREADNNEAEEDDGYLVTYVHDENTGKSTFVVMDAKSSNLEIVAKVFLPCRVPYGLHGLFVREKDLNNS